MRLFNVFALAIKLLKSQRLAGELTTLFLALTIAVTATTAVSFFTNRINQTLLQQGGLLLGGDLAITKMQPIPSKYLTEAVTRGLYTSETAEFPSMLVFKDNTQLVEIKAVDAAFPLRGDFEIRIGTAAQRAAHGPKQGEVWIGPQIADNLQVKVGDSLTVGAASLKVAAILVNEASRGGDMFSIAPRLLMHKADLPKTQLVQVGSRIKYQLLVSANQRANQSFNQINQFYTWVKPQLAAGERIDDVKNARPEIKSALDKAQQFLGLAAMTSVILAMVAMCLASAPYAQKNMDTYALLRCFGAAKKTIWQLLGIQVFTLALFASLLGCVLGYVIQTILSGFAANLFVERLAQPSLMPLMLGLLTGVGMMLAVLLPQLFKMSQVPVLRILRRDFLPHPQTYLVYLPAILLTTLLVYYQASSLKLTFAMLSIVVVILLLAMGLVHLMAKLIHLIPYKDTNSQLGFSSVTRRFSLVSIQVAGFSIGLMVLALLSIIRNDVLQNWQRSLPIDAPNRFIINIQDAQKLAVMKQLLALQIVEPVIFPMVRGRLTAINDAPIDLKNYPDERAKRLLQREFNLSMAEKMQADNKLVSGRWWQPNQADQPWISLEDGIAKTLNIKLGDRLRYEIAGQIITLTVESIRTVEWDSMRVNFFAVTPPKTLERYSKSYITSFYLPDSTEQGLNQLIKTFPNLTVIDLAALIKQVRDIIFKMTIAVQAVFAFSLLAGLAVLFAALQATSEERQREIVLFRILGASKQQLAKILLIEFILIALIASIVALLGANALAYYISQTLLNIPYQFNGLLALSVMTVAVVLIPTAAWLVSRKLLATPPRQLLQSI